MDFTLNGPSRLSCSLSLSLLLPLPANAILCYFYCTFASSHYGWRKALCSRKQINSDVFRIADSAPFITLPQCIVARHAIPIAEHNLCRRKLIVLSCGDSEAERFLCSANRKYCSPREIQTIAIKRFCHCLLRVREEWRRGAAECRVWMLFCCVFQRNNNESTSRFDY